MNTKYVIANWKMNMATPDVLDWVNKFSTNKKDTKIIIAASSIHIPLLTDIQNKYSISLSGQDISIFDKGAHTGSLGVFQLKEFCKYCIIGHSERKENLKIKILKRDLCLANEVTPIVCFTKPKEITKLKKDSCIFAWEDPSNISKDGVYKEKSTEEILRGVKVIRQKLGPEAILLYGGSVNRQNVHKLVEIEELDGILVGNASLDPTHFSELLAAYEIHGY